MPDEGLNVNTFLARPVEGVLVTPDVTLFPQRLQRPPVLP
jgi:hypothetical protein